MATTVSETAVIPLSPAAPRTIASALATLARRRAALTAGNPRQIAVPLLGPMLLAVIVAPALKVATGGLHSAHRLPVVRRRRRRRARDPAELHLRRAERDRRPPGGRAARAARGAGAAGPIWCSGNLVVAVVLSALQAVVLVGLTAVRGGAFPHQRRPASRGRSAAGAAVHGVHVRRSPRRWRAGSSRPEEYVGAVPAVAILPFFFAGALFPIGAMPGALTAIAKVLPLTHALALMRYGLVDPSGQGLHDIWGVGSTTAQAWASLARSGAVRRRADGDLDPRVHALGREIAPSQLQAPDRNFSRLAGIEAAKRPRRWGF